MNRFTFILSLLSVSPAFAGPGVVSVSPAPQSMTAGVMTEISVEFDTAIDPATVDGTTVMISGRWSGIPSGTFSLEDSSRVIRFVPTEPFSAGEWVTVSASKGIRNAGGEPMDPGYAWTFWIGAGPGTLDQTLIEVIPVREQGEGWIQTYGANAADLDNDGWTDLTLPNEISNDVRVFMNDGAGGYDSFTIHEIPNGSIPSTNEAVDLDGDGDFDFVVGSGGNNQMCIFIGDGAGSFESAASYTAGQSVRGVATLDLDGDGDMDVVTANRVASNLSIFLNNGDGTMQPAVTMDGNGVQETSLAAADANNDGILDLFVGALGSDEVILFLGDGNGGLVFSDEIAVGGSPWMLAAGDMDGDGNADVVAANSFENNAAVVFGDGDGGLSHVDTYPVGNFALAIDVGDLDGDGDLDLVTSNYSSGNWTLYENLGGGTMGNVRTLDASTAGSCATLHDRDNDGDLDITGIDEIDDQIFIFSNGGTTSVTQADYEPGGFRLNQNYPNPFNPSTAITFRLSETGFTTMKVYDVLGREVATLVAERLEPGSYEVSFDAGAFPSGVYYYRLQQGSSARTKKLLLAK